MLVLLSHQKYRERRSGDFIGMKSEYIAPARINVKSPEKETVRKSAPQRYCKNILPILTEDCALKRLF